MISHFCDIMLLLYAASMVSRFWASNLFWTRRGDHGLPAQLGNQFGNRL